MPSEVRVVNIFTFSYEADVVAVNIDQPWAEYFYSNADKSKWKMDPPSIQQIEESSLTEYQKQSILLKSYPDYYKTNSQGQKLDSESEYEQEDADSTSPFILTGEQLRIAKNEAVFRRDFYASMKSTPVSIEIFMSSDGQLLLTFDRPVHFSTYMIDEINQINSDESTNSDTMPSSP